MLGCFDVDSVADLTLGEAVDFLCALADDAMPLALMKERMFRQVRMVFDGLLD